MPCGDPSTQDPKMWEPIDYDDLLPEYGPNYADYGMIDYNMVERENDG